MKPPHKEQQGLQALLVAPLGLLVQLGLLDYVELQGLAVLLDWVLLEELVLQDLLEPLDLEPQALVVLLD